MSKLPFVDAETIRSIIREHPTPFHLYDERGIRNTAQDVNRAFSWNPGFMEYYAVKACPNPFILKILKEEGCGVDCSSMAELKLSEVCGFGGHHIMFSSNETPDEEFAYAGQLGAIINLDDVTHIEALQKNVGIPEEVCLRYNPGGELHFDNNCMGTPETAKFGMTRAQIFESVRRLKALGVRRFGLHSLLASNALSNDYYPGTARILFELAVDLHRELDVEISMVNLSGGVGIPYEPDEPAPDIFVIGEQVHNVYDEVLTAAGMGHVRIAAELGRFMTGPHGCLVATVIRKKHIYRDYLGLDACAANLMRPAIYGAYHHITVVGKEMAPASHTYDVVGSLCENNDKFAIDRPLPETEIGDIVVIHDTGAHGYSMGYNYNGRLRSAEYLWREDGSVQQIRRAETLRDYFATFDFDPDLKQLWS